MQSQNVLDNDKVRTKSGYLDIKLPINSRSRRQFKAWRKRWLDFQAHSDKVLLRIFISDSAASKQEVPLYNREMSSNQIIFYRSESKTHPYTFSIAEGKETILHFSASSETESQSWMKDLRNLIWPPNQILELENNLAGVHQVSIIDNEFSQRAGLLGAYGYMRITSTKIIIINPCMGHVVQEWYLNTLCRFQLHSANRKEDRNKLFSFESGSNSSTGKGTLYFFSENAVDILKFIGTTIQEILDKRKTFAQTKSERDKYLKELQELENSMIITSDHSKVEAEDYYQVPRREVRSLLDIPNFTFEKPLNNNCSDMELRGKNRARDMHVRQSCPEMNQYSFMKTDRKISLHIPDDLKYFDQLPEENSFKRETMDDLANVK